MVTKSPSLPLRGMLVLDKCALIESRCAEIYRHFAELHPELPELSTLWKKTAIEEEHHCLQFQMLSRMKGEGITGLTTDITRVTEVLKKLESLFEQVQHGTLTAIDTLKLGIKLENYLSEFHSPSVIICSDPELAHLLNAMMDIDTEHVARLEKELDKLMKKKGGPPAAG